MKTILIKVAIILALWIFINFTPTDMIRQDMDNRNYVNIQRLDQQTSSESINKSININTTKLINKIQPMLIPANRVNPNNPLCKSFGGPCDIYIYKLPNTNPSVLVFESSGAIDCDGQSTDKCNAQTDDEYRSQTAFEQSDGQPLIASVLPYYVLPNNDDYFNYVNFDINGGQIGLIIYREKMNYGVFGDTNSDPKAGEVSYAMASSLGIDPNPTSGGVAFGVWFLIFTGSENVVFPIENHSKAIMIGEDALNKLLIQMNYPA